MTKKQLIKRVNNLPFGDIFYGYDRNGKVININEYDEETDTFNAYGEDCKCYPIKFEDIPQNLCRA